MRHIASTLLDTTGLPDVPCRGLYSPDDEDCESLTLSPDDDRKLTIASRWSRSLVTAARAGDPQALAAMQKMGVVRYEVTR